MEEVDSDKSQLHNPELDAQVKSPFAETEMEKSFPPERPAVVEHHLQEVLLLCDTQPSEMLASTATPKEDQLDPHTFCVAERERLETSAGENLENMMAMGSQIDLLDSMVDQLELANAAQQETIEALEDQLHETEERLEVNEDMMKCLVCLDRRASFVFSDCGHLAACAPCAEGWKANQLAEGRCVVDQQFGFEYWQCMKCREWGLFHRIFFPSENH